MPAAVGSNVLAADLRCEPVAPVQLKEVPGANEVGWENGSVVTNTPGSNAQATSPMCRLVRYARNCGTSEGALATQLCWADWYSPHSSTTIGTLEARFPQF